MCGGGVIFADRKEGGSKMNTLIGQQRFIHCEKLGSEGEKEKKDPF